MASRWGHVSIRLRAVGCVFVCWVAVVLGAGSAGAASWSVQPTPSVPDSGTGPGENFGGGLVGVSCASARACIAVGQVEGSALVERWNGILWSLQTIQAVAGQRGGELSGVSCWSAAGCVAVGYSVRNPEAAPLILSALVEYWNGTRWSIERTPGPVGAHESALSGVSCWSQRHCMAVGYSATAIGGKGVAHAERWNGVRWSIQHLSDSTRHPSRLNDVACTSRRFCMAVGEVWRPDILLWPYGGPNRALERTVVGSSTDTAKPVHCWLDGRIVQVANGVRRRRRALRPAGGPPQSYR